MLVSGPQKYWTGLFGRFWCGMPGVTEYVREVSPTVKRMRLDEAPAEAAPQPGNLEAEAAEAAPAPAPKPPIPPPQDPRMPNFWHGVFLAPMVRIGSLPTRLLALEYGADLVWGPEVVDRAILGTERVVRPETGLVEYLKEGRQIFSCHPVERRHLIYQLGSGTPELAEQAVAHVTAHDDVAGVDLNCGCPKPFSTLGGMGSNLLTAPDTLCAILEAMRRAAPPHVSVTAKIRLLPTQADTLALVERIVRTRTIRALTVHCRTKDMRPREPALLDRLREIMEHVTAVARETGQDVPVVCNGDCFGHMDVARIRELTGVTSVMIARGAEANPSCFREVRDCVATGVAPKWLRYAVWFDNPFGNTKYCIVQLAFTPSAGLGSSERVSSLPKRALVEMRTALSQCKSNEELCRALRLEWPLPLGNVLGDVRAALERRGAGDAAAGGASAANGAGPASA